MIAKEKENKEDFVVIYFGSNLPLQGVDIVLKSAKLLEDKPNIKYIVIGNIKPQKEYENMCLVGHFNEKIEKAKRTIPCKAYICKAMNKKMILGRNKANMERFQDKDENIYYVEMGNSRELAKKIYQISKEKSYTKFK